MDNIEKILKMVTYKHPITCDKCGKIITSFTNHDDQEENILYYRIENNSFFMKYNKILCTSCFSEEKNKITNFLIESGFEDRFK